MQARSRDSQVLPRFLQIVEALMKEVSMLAATDGPRAIDTIETMPTNSGVS
jgi:hypothetical protein